MSNVPRFSRIEMCLIIIMGTIPTLRPLFVKLFRTVSSLSKSRKSKSNGGLGTGGSMSKETYDGGSMQLRPVIGSKPNGANRGSHTAIGSSESEENILPRGNGIVVKSDFDVNYAERVNLPAEEHSQ